jgi:hypothetical protein
MNNELNYATDNHTNNFWKKVLLETFFVFSIIGKMFNQVMQSNLSQPVDYL